MRSTLIASIYFAPVLEELCGSQQLDELSCPREQLSEVRIRSTRYACLRLEGSAQEVSCPVLLGQNRDGTEGSTSWTPVQ